MSRHIDNPFIQLIQCCIGKRNSLDSTLTLQQWDDICYQAKIHSILGITYDALMRLEEEQRPSRKIKVLFALSAEKIADSNKRLNSHLPELKKIFYDAGMQVCVLKGQGIAALYPMPEHRQCGDIDLWVSGDFKKILKFVKSNGWKLSRLYKHHIGVGIFNDKVEVEVHFRPSWFNNPITNFKFKRYCASVSAVEFSNESKELGIAVSTIHFNCVFILLHIFRHLLDEGVGLRQLIDYYYVLVNSSQADRKDAYETIKNLSLVRFTSALMWSMREIFNLDEEYMICAPNESGGKLLLREILISGNFGIYDKRNDDKGRSFLYHFLRRNKRIFKFLPLNASEVLWAPVFRIYQYLWRICQGYRY